MGRQFGSDAVARFVGGIERTGEMARSKAKTAEAEQVTEETAGAPDGYAVREVTLPERHWQTLDRFAEMAGVSVSEWLERYLRFMAR